MSVGVKYPLELDQLGGLMSEVNLPFERVLSVLLTEKLERPLHPAYGNPAPIFSNINRDTVEFPKIEDVETEVSVRVGGLIVAVKLTDTDKLGLN
jgi:hypothetical protein